MLWGRSLVMKTKLQSLGFTACHVHLLLVAFALFSVLMVAKSDISIKALFVKADDNVEMLTYEGVRDEILAQRGEVAPQTDAEAEAQFALLDRSLDNGQVLGESIGLDKIPGADEIFSTENLNQIPVNSISTNSASDFKIYSDQILYIESSNDVITLLANINSGDQAVIKQAQDQATKIIQMMALISVPEQFVEYHRYKTLYYTSLTNLADIWMNNKPESDLQTQSTMLFSVMTKVESLKTELQNKYQIQL